MEGMGLWEKRRFLESMGNKERKMLMNNNKTNKKLTSVNLTLRNKTVNNSTQWQIITNSNET